MAATIQHQLEPSTKILTITVPGDVLSTNAETLRDQMLPLIQTEENAQNWETLRLDLNQAKMIDSVGLNLLVRICRVAKEKNRKVQAAISSANIYRTFIFTRLNLLLEIDLPEALRKSATSLGSDTH